jgi:ribosomal protein L2
MSELSAGVRALLGRMESNPEEFYGDASKWAFMFAPNFRDVMTEPEKGALHEALKEARRKEFDELVMRRILRDNEEETVKQARSKVFGAAQIRAEGQQIEHDKARNAYTQTINTGQGLLGSINTYNPYK